MERVFSYNPGAPHWADELFVVDSFWDKAG